MVTCQASMESLDSQSEDAVQSIADVSPAKSLEGEGTEGKGENDVERGVAVPKDCGDSVTRNNTNGSKLESRDSDSQRKVTLASVADSPVTTLDGSYNGAMTEARDGGDVERGAELPEGSQSREIAPPVEKGLETRKDRFKDHLWRDILPTVDLSELCYSLVKIRNAAREGKVTEAVLHPPFSLDLVLNIIDENDAMIEDLTGAKTADEKRRALKNLKDECVFGIESATTERTKELLDGTARTFSEINSITEIRQGVSFVEIDDEKQDDDLVYFIALSHPRRRIYVVFRGSATPNDFMIDFSMKFQSVPNPVKGDESLDKQVMVHGGFYEYLLEQKETGTPEKPRSKLDRIMDKVKHLLRENDGYELFATGHSLGAALSTLFSFYAAANADDLGIGKPVKCINIGSPKAGDESFRRAFKVLEKRGKIFHLRVVNDADPIPRMPRRDPVRSGCAFFFVPAYRYRHVGMCLALYGKPSWQVLFRRLFNPFYWFLHIFILISYQKRPSFVIHNREYQWLLQTVIDLFGDLELFLLTLFLCMEGPKQGQSFTNPFYTGNDFLGLERSIYLRFRLMIYTKEWKMGNAVILRYIEWEYRFSRF